MNLVYTRENIIILNKEKSQIFNLPKFTLHAACMP